MSDHYTPTFKPELADEVFKQLIVDVADRTVVSRDRLHVLYTLLKQSAKLLGEVWECGVYRGGTALLMAKYLNTLSSKPKVCVFDSFEGLPAVGEVDQHHVGDFGDVNFEDVKSVLSPYDFVEVCKGWIPGIFHGKEDTPISFIHVDVDLYQSVLDCCNFTYPLMVSGGIMLFDDYGFNSCKGAKKAVDEFFEDKKSVPLVLPTGQAIVFII